MADDPESARHALAPGRQRGPMVDMDPSGQVTLREPDHATRQFLNYAFFKLDPAFRRLSRDERGAAAQEAISLVREWERKDDVILRTYSLVGLRADRSVKAP